MSRIDTSNFGRAGAEPSRGVSETAETLPRLPGWRLLTHLRTPKIYVIQILFLPSECFPGKFLRVLSSHNDASDPSSQGSEMLALVKMDRQGDDNNDKDTREQRKGLQY
jgi:hypothetical protein